MSRANAATCARYAAPTKTPCIKTCQVLRRLVCASKNRFMLQSNLAWGLTMPRKYYIIIFSGKPQRNSHKRPKWREGAICKLKKH